MLSFYLCDFSKKMCSWCCPDMFMVRTERMTYDETSLSSVQSVPWTCICSWTADTMSAVHEQLVFTILTCQRQKNGYFIAKHDWMTWTGRVQPLDKTCSKTHHVKVRVSAPVNTYTQQVACMRWKNQALALLLIAASVVRTDRNYHPARPAGAPRQPPSARTPVRRIYPKPSHST